MIDEIFGMQVMFIHKDMGLFSLPLHICQNWMCLQYKVWPLITAASYSFEKSMVDIFWYTN